MFMFRPDPALPSGPWNRDNQALLKLPDGCLRFKVEEKPLMRVHVKKEDHKDHQRIEIVTPEIGDWSHCNIMRYFWDEKNFLPEKVNGQASFPMSFQNWRGEACCVRTPLTMMTMAMRRRIRRMMILEGWLGLQILPKDFHLWLLTTLISDAERRSWQFSERAFFVEGYVRQISL